MQLYFPIAEMPLNLFVVAFLGMSIGLIAGMFGVGGGFLLTPLLIFLGVPPAISVGTSSVHIASSSAAGTMNHYRKGTLDPRLASVLALGGFFGAIGGIASFDALLRIGQLDLIVSVFYFALLASVGTLMLVERAILIHRRAIGRVPTVSPPAKEPWHKSWPLRMRFERAGLETSPCPFILAGAIVGFIGTLLGIGGSFILIPILIYIFGIPASLAIGTSQFHIFFTMAIATLLHALTAQSVDLLLAFLLIVGGVAGTQIGFRLSQRLKSDYFLIVLALLILGASLGMGKDLIFAPQQPYSFFVLEKSS